VTPPVAGASTNRRGFLGLLAGQSPQVSGSQVGVSMPPTLAIKMAVVVVTVAPIMLVYPFVQRHFVKGVIVGAVKG
jgi:putative aldouronate transport system permease protein